MHSLENVCQGLLLLLTTDADLLILVIILCRVDFRRENTLLLLPCLEVDDVGEALSLKLADKLLTIVQQACLVKDHIVATRYEIDR